MREFLKSIRIIRIVGEPIRYFLFSIQRHFAEQDDKKHPIDENGVAIPPARLRHRVHGALDRDSFLNVGKNVSNDLRRFVKTAGHEWGDFKNILDFGCGSARVMRYFLANKGNAQYSGIDIDSALIDWCQSNIPGVHWQTNGYHPPTEFADNSFDLVYAISVFTHLNEEFQNEWLQELHRITSPGAILILTVHGEPLFANAAMNSKQRTQLAQDGFLFVTGTTGKLKLDGLPDFYQTAYHSQPYINRVWGKLFEIVAHVPQGIGHNQNAVILKRN